MRTPWNEVATATAVAEEVEVAEQATEAKDAAALAPAPTAPAIEHSVDLAEAAASWEGMPEPPVVPLTTPRAGAVQFDFD